MSYHDPRWGYPQQFWPGWDQGQQAPAHGHSWYPNVGQPISDAYFSYANVPQGAGTNVFAHPAPPSQAVPQAQVDFAMLSGPMGPVPMKVGIHREPGLGEDPGMEEPLLPTKMGSATATELGKALGESIKEGSGPEAKMSPCSMTRASLKESLHAIKESVKQGLGLSPGVVMMEVDVTEMNPFSKEKWGIDGDSTTIWVPQSTGYREGESFFGPPLKDIFGEKNVKVSNYSSTFGAFGVRGGAQEGGPPSSSSGRLLGMIPPASEYQWLHTSRGVERVPVKTAGKSPGNSGPGSPSRGGNQGETGRPESHSSPTVSQVLQSVFGIGPTSGS